MVRSLAVLLTLAAALHATGSDVAIKLGAPETVLADKALGLRAFPDGRLALVRTKPDCRVILAAGVASFVLEGPEMGKFTKATRVLEKGKPGEFDNGYAGINSVVRIGTGKLLAFYHAEDQEEMTTVGSGIPGFYCRVALAVSEDEGMTFAKRGPVLSGNAPKKANGLGDQGVGEPWIVSEPSGQYLYAYYTSHERSAGRTVDICMARCPVAEATELGAWKKFHAGDFSEPGLGGSDTPVVTSGAPDADALFAQVVLVPELHQFVMTFGINAWRETANAERTGIYMAFSDDGVHWPTERRRQIWKVPVIARDGHEVAWHPTFVPDETTGKRGWLYYGYSKNWGWQPPSEPHYLVRRRVELGSGPQESLPK